MPLQAVTRVSETHVVCSTDTRTEFFLNDLEYLLLVKLLGQSLHGSQGLATIAFWRRRTLASIDSTRRHGSGVEDGWMHTLNPDMDVILALFSLPSIFVGFGEGVYNAGSVSMLQGSTVGFRNRRRSE